MAIFQLFHILNLNQWLVSHPHAVMKAFPHLQELIVTKCIYNNIYKLLNKLAMCYIKTQLRTHIYSLVPDW